jgi:hypothetical protein
MKKLNLALLGLMACSLFIGQQTATATTNDSPVILYVDAYLAPHVNNTAPSVSAGNIYVASKYAGQSVSNKITNHKLLTTYVSVPPDQTVSNVLWFGLHAVSKTTAFKFNPKHLVFVEKSSDSANKLGKTNEFMSQNYVATDRAMIVDWNGLPKGSSDTKITSGDWVPGNEFDFAGSMSAYFNSAPTLDAALHSLTDFQVTGTWMLMDDTGTNVLASTSVTLHMNLDPQTGVLTIRPQGSDMSALGINAGQHDSYILQSNTSATTSNWQDEAIINSGDLFSRSHGSGQSMFWRAILQ